MEDTITRRKAVQLIGIAGVSSLAGCSVGSSCPNPPENANTEEMLPEGNDQFTQDRVTQQYAQTVGAEMGHRGFYSGPNGEFLVEILRWENEESASEATQFYDQWLITVHNGRYSYAVDGANRDEAIILIGKSNGMSESCAQSRDTTDGTSEGSTTG